MLMVNPGHSARDFFICKKNLNFFFNELSKYKICKVPTASPSYWIGQPIKTQFISEPTRFLKQVRQNCILFLMPAGNPLP